MLALVLLLQAGGWSAAPATPTVGDTIWLTRGVGAPPGWRVRAGKLDARETLEPLSDPIVWRASDGWVVRYAVVTWTPGPHTVALPPIWRLGPDGRSDSLPGGRAAFTVRSVIPGALSKPEPRGALVPVRRERRDPAPAIVALLLAGGVLTAGVWSRRRRPRQLPPPPQVPLELEVADARWLAAGEPKAVAARATGRLRAALARLVPAAHAALSTAECLAAVERARPDAPLPELREVLQQLEGVAFASAHGVDVAGLAGRARALARRVAP